MRKLNASKLSETLSARIGYGVEHAYYAGVQLLVRQRGETVCRLSMGYSDIWEKTPLHDGSMFRLASMTKPVTAVAALIGVQNGWFKLDDPVEQHLPEFSDMQIAAMKDREPVADHPAQNKLRMFHLLTHTSGILSQTPIGSALFEKLPDSAFTSVSAMTAGAAALPLAFEPMRYTAYTGYASFDAVATVLERKSGMPFADFVQKNIFDPLGINNLTFRPTEEQWKNFVSMHDRTDNRTLFTAQLGRHIFEGFPLSYTCAGAGLAGTLDDYGIFAEMLRCGGEYRGTRIVSPELIDEMRRPWVPAEIPGRNQTDSWGLGVRVVDRPSVLPIGSFGWSGAYGTHFWVDPENEITAVFLKNNLHYDAHGCGQSGVQFERDVMSCLEE